eukprot:502641-Amphidinium_carterae.1
MTGRPGWAGLPRHPRHQELVRDALCGGTQRWNHRPQPPVLATAPASCLAEPVRARATGQRPMPSPPPPFMAGRWKVWTEPDGWQNWTYQDSKEPLPTEGADAQTQAPAEVKVEPTSHSQSAGSQDEWVGWATTRGHRSTPWGTGAAATGKGDRARSASPAAPMVVAKRRRRGAANSSRSRGPQAWSHPPVRTQAIAPEAKKRPRSDSPTGAKAGGFNNLQGVKVTMVDGQLQMDGPPAKLALVDPIAKQLLYLGDRRGAQDHLRNNRRAIRNRFEEYFQHGEQETPEQLQRFADAKARRLPWEADSTTRYIIYGEEVPDEAPPSVHIQVGLDAPPILSTHPSQYRTRGGLGSNQPPHSAEENSPSGLWDARDRASQQADLLDL